MLVPTLVYRTILRHCDGTATQEEIRSRARSEAGLEIPAADLAGLVDQLDRSLVLDGPGHLRLPRDELRHAFVLKPLAEIAPGFVDPVSGCRLGAMWRAHPDHDVGFAPVAI